MPYSRRSEPFPTHPGSGSDILIRAWGSWLTTLPWSDFFTGTFKEERPSAKSCLGCVRGLRNSLLRDAWGSPQIFAVVEGGMHTLKRMHVHALVGWSGVPEGRITSSRVRRRAAWDYWFSRYGRARCEPVTRERCFYASKYVVKSAFSTGEVLFLTSDDWPPHIHT